MELFPAQGAMSANQDLDNTCFPVNSPLNQKCNNLVSQSPNAKPTLGLLTPNKTNYMTTANQIFFICLFLYFLSYKIFLPSAPFCRRLSTS